jgi:hypothetical protein
MTAAGPVAQKVLISMDRVNRGPPPPFARWGRDSILALLRSAGIDAEQIVNWTRAPARAGFLIYYHGEEASEKMRLRLI